MCFFSPNRDGIIAIVNRGGVTVMIIDALVDSTANFLEKVNPIFDAGGRERKHIKSALGEPDITFTFTWDTSPATLWATNSRLLQFQTARISSGDITIQSTASQETFWNEKYTAKYSLEFPPLVYVPLAPPASQQDDAARAYSAFLKTFPEYQTTWIIDTLRRTDFARLDRVGETYVDYMGGSQLPESLVRVHGDFLTQSVMGNTHSVSSRQVYSKLSTRCADEARDAILSFFRAPSGYTVIFTANATGALKLVGEAFPFTEDSCYVLGTDSHNSVHGIRQYASRRGAQVHYIPSMSTGGFVPSTAKEILRHHKSKSNNLFALTGQSNISNAKNPLSILDYASSLGYYTLLDAAALAPTSVISLSETPVDAMAVSFYKMFGYPTGVGALVVKESFLQQLERPWFAGGTVDIVQVPGPIITRTARLHEQFEDGTINYLTLPAVTDGLRFLSAYLPFLPLRLSCLLHFLTTSILRLRHDSTGTPVVKILSKLPSRRLRSVGEQADTGSIISLVFLSPSGQMMPNSFIEYVAVSQSISLRTGCMCNPGGAAALLGIESDMDRLYPGVTLKDFEAAVGRELGVVRISLGLASTFQDVWKVIRFVATIANDGSRQSLWDSWMNIPIGQAV
ncbi:pyridoxal phosphate-dependent transferase [Hygrophoropsis aurantiaca]|uniref:Pyridoxal phosphate-dependent transferase n=1 Tax=Hygrophoropsis aurantiaca TaxID=72124 RepID=A0ACB8AJ20_9AGAM|nr:pyridoxal phosphate-dependent transferase [Hygrophoropsis aurantiaca]